MRCIETQESGEVPQVPFVINRNMRCIETNIKEAKSLGIEVINRNMRCIETKRDKGGTGRGS